MTQRSKVRCKLHMVTAAASILIVGLTLLAILDTAAAGAGTDNRAPTPKTASTSNGGSHGTIVNDTRATPTVKTDKLCPGHHCHHYPGDHQ